MLIVGLAGASGSGKTRLAQALRDRLNACGTSSEVVSVDWFYKAPVPAVVSVFCKARGAAWMQQTIKTVRASSGIPADLAQLPAPELIAALETQQSVDAGTYNWDTPSAIDLDDLCATIARLRDGKSASVAEFNFTTRQRDRRRDLQTADIIIVEGLFAFATPELEAAVDCKIFVDAPKAKLWARKLARDSQAGRGGHDEAYLARQFELAWAQSLLHVAPTKELEGVLVVSNDDDDAWDALVDEVVCCVTSAAGRAGGLREGGDDARPASKRAKGDYDRDAQSSAQQRSPSSRAARRQDDER